MNAKYLIATVTMFAAAGSVLADNTNLSRAEVRAELERAYAAGEATRIVVPEAGYVAPIASAKSVTEVRAELKADRQPTIVVPEAPVVANVASTRTRAEVRAELEHDHAAGHHASLAVPEAGETTQIASTRTRDEVRKEAIQAAKSKQVKESNFGG